MNAKNNFMKIIAICLSIIFFVSSIIAYFTMPLELVFFNVENIHLSLGDKQNLILIPKIIGELTGDILYASYGNNSIPQIIAERSEFKTIIQEYIPRDWAEKTIKDFVTYSYKFLNFRTTESSLKLNVSELKDALISNAGHISKDIYDLRIRCDPQNSDSVSNKSQTIFDLPTCRLAGEQQISNSFFLEAYLEQKFIQIPTEIEIDYVFFGNQNNLNGFFTAYTLLRWLIRLMPLIALVLLILISLTLKDFQNLKLKWIGRLLLLSSSLTLIFLIILLIGFNQFMSFIISNVLPYFIPGFDEIILRVSQDIGSKTLIWTAVVACAALLIGVLLVLLSKFFRNPKLKKEPEINEQQAQLKEIQPETMEQTEAKEQTLKEIKAKE